MTRASDQFWGTVLVVAASFTFACIALVVQVDVLPILWATEARFLVCWLVAVTFMASFKASRNLQWFGPPALRNVLFLKAVLSFSFVSAWWAALRQAPVGDCIAIIYCGPILTSLWSAGMLGEELPSAFPLQAVLVMVGVMLIVDPPFLHYGLVLPDPKGDGDYRLVFAGLLINSVIPIVTRQTRACSWIEVEHVCSFSASWLLNPLLLSGQYNFYGTLPKLPKTAIREGALIILAALGAFVAVALETRGYQLAEPGKAAMFRYVEVPFAYVLQLAGTQQPVQLQAAIGSLLIIASVGLGAVEQRARENAQQKAKHPEAEALLGKDVVAA